MPPNRRFNAGRSRRTARGTHSAARRGWTLSQIAWQRTVRKAGVRRILPYDLRHTYASLRIAAGKNPLYIARQMGHYSTGFMLDTYGHLIEALPKRQTEWIDEIVFPEGFAAALNLHL